MESGKSVKVIQAASVRFVTFSPDGKTLATSHGVGGPRGNGSIQLWDATSWEEKGATAEF